MANEDLWKPIWEHVLARPKNWIQIRKTKAHCNPEALVDLQLVWEAKANNFVDQVAKKVVTDWKDVFPLMEKRFELIITEKNMMKQVHDLLLEQANVSMEKQVQNGDNVSQSIAPRATTTERKPNPSFCDPFVLVIPDAPCKFGDIFFQRVKTWAEKLTWPTASTGHVSLLELYIDFTLYTKSLSPVPVGGSKGVKVQKYVLKDLDPTVATVHQSLAQQNVIWIRFLRWAESNGFFAMATPNNQTKQLFK